MSGRTPPDDIRRTPSDDASSYLAAIVESSDDAIISKDLNGVIQSCNASAERLFGYPAAELIGRPVRILIPRERQSEEDDILFRIRRGERVEHFETVRQRKDGTPVEISLTVSPVRDALGNIIGVSKIARDITERKRAAAERAAQQAWFKVTLGSIGEAVVAADPDGRVNFMNAAAEGLTGWTLADATGCPLDEIFRIFDERTGEAIESPAAVVRRTGDVAATTSHALLAARAGGRRPIATNAAPILAGDGSIIGVVLVFRDVTDERRAEAAVAEQREWFKTTLESIGDAVIATDVDGRIAFMNPVAEHLTGWRLDDALGRKCDQVFRIVQEGARIEVANPVQRVLTERTKASPTNHSVLVALDGTERPVDDSGAPIRDSHGRIVGVVLVFRDVSERRRIEMERQAVTNERERLLESERLARADAEKASRVKDDFVAMVSHELRTPLNAILGWTHLMSQDSGDAEVIERGLDVVARNTRVQAQLIGDLLDISRIVAGRLQLEVQYLDFAAILREAIDTIRREAEIKRIEIVQQVEGDIGPMTGDPARLQQVIWNLLSNAIKFTPSGGRVTITLSQGHDDLELVVSDTGVGIAPDVLPHVFERFQQADRSVTRRFGGLGLGLSIVKHLVDLHGGTVSVASPGAGGGATFTLTFPVTAGVAAGVVPESELVPALSAPPVSLEGLQILVVEDEPDTREFLARLLGNHGARVTTAGTASEAIAQFRLERPHVLVSDIGLPDVDGYDLLRTIRGQVAGDEVPAIALTAYARSEDRERALQAGFQGHLSKPIDAAELIAAVSRLRAPVAPGTSSSPD